MRSARARAAAIAAACAAALPFSACHAVVPAPSAPSSASSASAPAGAASSASAPGAGSAAVTSPAPPAVSKPAASSKASSSKAPSKASSAAQTTSATKVTVDGQTLDITPGSLTALVNKKFPVAASYAPTFGKLDLKYYTSSSKDNRFDARALPYLKQMLDDAAAQDVTLKIVSGFRTYDYQKGNIERKVSQFKAKGLSDAAARVQAAAVVAPPGTSEHETGLAADIVSADWYQKHSDLTDDYDQTPEYAWLAAHCTEYGFILRYPKNKQTQTSIIYEPWHYRYVGAELAKKIKASGLCLEEYYGLPG